MRIALLLIAILPLAAQAAPRKAKNVILFIGDAGGIPTLHAASVYKYDHPQKLFIQTMPHIALMDTSAADVWVTDSAAGMSAIVTGEKTYNGVISQSADGVRGKKDGKLLQTILEHAEQRGLATGVLSNMNITDATPAACYAHSNDRSKAGEIFAQILKPRFGDGVNVVIGAGRSAILKATAAIGLKVEPELRAKGYSFCDKLDAVSTTDRRVVALLNTSDFSVEQAVDKAAAILSKNRKGYFLMVEWDTHTDNLIVFAADHSFDLRVRAGRRGQPILPDGPPAAKPNIRVEDGHTGEQVLVAAKGSGARAVGAGSAGPGGE
jgi:alkaline phosphatase